MPYSKLNLSRLAVSGLSVVRCRKWEICHAYHSIANVLIHRSTLSCFKIQITKEVLTNSYNYIKGKESVTWENLYTKLKNRFFIEFFDTLLQALYEPSYTPTFLLYRLSHILRGHNRDDFCYVKAEKSFSLFSLFSDLAQNHLGTPRQWK